MARRKSISLHDIIASDHRAQVYYKRLKVGEDIEELRPPTPSFNEVITISLPDGKLKLIECDPMLVAEYLVIKEEEEEQEKLGDEHAIYKHEVNPTHPIASSSKDRKRSISFLQDRNRKKSAADEHERIRLALQECGIILE